MDRGQTGDLREKGQQASQTTTQGWASVYANFFGWSLYLYQQGLTTATQLTLANLQAAARLAQQGAQFTGQAIQQSTEAAQQGTQAAGQAAQQEEVAETVDGADDGPAPSGIASTGRAGSPEPQTASAPEEPIAAEEPPPAQGGASPTGEVPNIVEELPPPPEVEDVELPPPPPATPNVVDELPPTPAPEAPAETVPAETGAGPEQSERSPVRIFKITPAARRAADEMGVDLGAVEGTGRGGQITVEDVRRAGQNRQA